MNFYLFTIIAALGISSSVVHAEDMFEMTECSVLVDHSAEVKIANSPDSMSNAVLKWTGEIEVGRTGFIFILTSPQDHYFESKFQLRSEESSWSNLDFNVSGFNYSSNKFGDAANLMVADFSTNQFSDYAQYFSARMHWNRYDKEQGPTAAFQAGSVAVEGSSRKYVYFVCGPLGWTDSKK